MAKKQKQARFSTEHASFLTVGTLVYLGRCSPRTRRNAIKAGLTPVTAKKLRDVIVGLQSIQRIDKQGSWYDTVKY